MALCLDTHCHLDADEFAADRDGVIERAALSGVSGVLIPAVRARDYLAVKDLAHHAANTLPATCYTLGIHPIYTPEAKESDLVTLRESVIDAMSDPRFVGIGEIGLDYFLPELDSHHQAFFFEANSKTDADREKNREKERLNKHGDKNGKEENGSPADCQQGQGCA